MSLEVFLAVLLTACALFGVIAENMSFYGGRLWKILRFRRATIKLALYPRQAEGFFQPQSLYDFYSERPGHLHEDGSFERYEQGELIYRCTTEKPQDLPVFWTLNSVLNVTIYSGRHLMLSQAVWEELTALAQSLQGQWHLLTPDPQALLQLNFAGFQFQNQ